MSHVLPIGKSKPPARMAECSSRVSRGRRYEGKKSHRRKRGSMFKTAGGVGWACGKSENFSSACSNYIVVGVAVVSNLFPVIILLIVTAGDRFTDIINCYFHDNWQKYQPAKSNTVLFGTEDYIQSTAPTLADKACVVHLKTNCH